MSNGLVASSFTPAAFGEWRGPGSTTNGFNYLHMLDIHLPKLEHTHTRERVYRNGLVEFGSGLGEIDEAKQGSTILLELIHLFVGSFKRAHCKLVCLT